MTDMEQDPPLSLTKPLAPEIRVATALPPAPQHVAPYVPAPMPYAPAPMPYATSSTTVVVQQSNVEIIVAWIFTALTLLYMLPWAIAATRRSTNSILIAIATFFLAWTVLGWLVMLVLSFLGPTVHSVRSTTAYAALPPPPPAGAWAHCAGDPPHVRRWWDDHAWTGHTTTL